MIKVVDLVLFSANKMLFGVLAHQVEELLDVKGLHEPKESDVEDAITYKGQHLRVINFAKWVAQSRIMGGNREINIQTSLPPEAQIATRSLAFENSDAPKILIIKHRQEGHLGVYVDNVEDLVRVPLEHLHSLPVIMQKTGRIQGLWGITIVADRAVLLIDFEQLQNKSKRRGDEISA